MLNFTILTRHPMAKASSILRLQGTIQEITFYQRNGKWFARAKSSLTGKKVKKSPRFKRSMENMREFGATSVITKQVWACFPKNWKHFRDTGAFNRYKSIVYRVMMNDAGDRGQHAFRPTRLWELWQGFPFHKEKYFGSSCHADFSSAWDPATGILSLALPATAGDLMLDPSGGATHARIDFAGIILTPYLPNTALEQWISDPEWRSEFFATTSCTFPIADATILPPPLTLSFPATPNLPPGYLMQALVGISFYQEVASVMNLLPDKSSMMILKVWG